MTVQRVVVLGGGSAGLLAALALKRKLPELSVRVVRSADLGIIGVGEGTTLPFPKFLFQYLGLSKQLFHAHTGATWKLGLRFIWGPRPVFYFPFADEPVRRLDGISNPPGFMAGEDVAILGSTSALMHAEKAFPRRLDGWPQFQTDYALHIENARLVAWLEKCALEIGVEFTEGTVQSAETAEADGEQIVTALRLESGEKFEGDLFVDASGFRGELIDRVFHEPYVSYDRTLFCDRAVIGGWQRTDEPILPYTTCETMNAGWCWQIEHETFINRGYVYSSRFIDEETALREFLAANPKVIPEKTRVVRFPSGRRARMWVGNVVAIGNSGGFVEPLEATALGVICLLCSELVETLAQTQCAPTPGMKRIWNQNAAEQWDDVRDFLAVHYAFNTRLDTEFWKTCRAEVDLAGAAPIVELYRENGPVHGYDYVAFRRNSAFGIGSYLALLAGQRVPFDSRRSIPEKDLERWAQWQAHFAAEAQRGCDVRECLNAIRHPAWAWT
jgi:tryptophan halogenase